MGWLEAFFGGNRTGDQDSKDPEHSAILNRIEQALTGVSENDARFLACVALLCARVADTDSTISEGEIRRVREVVKSQLRVSDGVADSVTELAIEGTRRHSVEQHLVMRRLNEVATRDQKLTVIRLLFHIACEDDVSEAESDEIGRIAAGLLLARSEFIALRSEFRDHLALLKT